MEIRKFEPQDRDTFFTLAQKFYATDAVSHGIPEGNILDAFSEITSDSPYIDGFFVLHNGEVAGYAILTYTYSMEVGGMLAVLDELFIASEFQGHGLGTAFLNYMKAHLSEGIKAFRLEFVSEKEELQRLYEKQGFKMMGYSSMIQKLS